MRKPKHDPRTTPVFIRHAGMRPVTMEEVLAAIGGLGTLAVPPIDEPVDTAQFADEIESGAWSASHGEVWTRARAIRQRLQALGAVRVVYAGGMPEVPHAIAFGAYLEEQWSLELYDYHDGKLGWPSEKRKLELAVSGLPNDPVGVAGPAVIRVELSYRIVDESIAEFVLPEERVADVRIAPVEREPMPGIVRSQLDVDEVRRAIREAVLSLVERRPRMTAIHLFVAAQTSACVVVGQELRLRNHGPVQTYRFRKAADGSKKTTEALRLTASGPGPTEIPLTEEQAARAVSLRVDLWATAVADIEHYVNHNQMMALTTGGRWYDLLPNPGDWQRVRPFPALPPAHQVIKRPSTIANLSFDGDGFGFVREDRVWRINDRFSVHLEEQFNDVAERVSLARIFLFHEYLHEVHGITKESYREVGKFPNALERADYMCDLYGVLHELDLESMTDPDLIRDFDRYKRRVSELIDLVLRSYWVFERPAPLVELEVRRIRRYLNWYWQRERVRRSNSSLQLAAILGRQPVIELAGLATRAEGRRHYASLLRRDRDVGLEIAVVLDSEQLFRIKSGVNTPIEELVAAFRNKDHEQIHEFFRRAFAEAEMTGNVLPLETDLP
jgi:hypothetical protein